MRTPRHQPHRWGRPISRRLLGAGTIAILCGGLLGPVSAAAANGTGSRSNSNRYSWT